MTDMDVCDGTRRWQHDQIVHNEKSCPLCAEHDDHLATQQALDAAEEARQLAEKALTDFETDLQASMRMIRDAKRAVEAEDDHT